MESTIHYYYIVLCFVTASEQQNCSDIPSGVEAYQTSKHAQKSSRVKLDLTKLNDRISIYFAKRYCNVKINSGSAVQYKTTEGLLLLTIVNMREHAQRKVADLV